MGIWKQFAEYLYLKKRDPNDKPIGWTKYMHRMNRLSLFMFIVALLVILFKSLILQLIRK
jgi:hypothetical protein